MRILTQRTSCLSKVAKSQDIFDYKVTKTQKRRLIEKNIRVLVSS